MIQAFSERYAVHQDSVVKYLHHLAYLQMMKQKRERERKEKAERESKLGYEDVDWEKLVSEGLLRKQKVSILNLYIEHHSLTTEKKLPQKKKLDLVSAHIQLSAALGGTTASTIKDTTDCQSNATSSETSEGQAASSESDDCVLHEVGSDTCTSEEDNIPLAHLYTCNSWSDSDVPLSKLGNKS